MSLKVGVLGLDGQKVDTTLLPEVFRSAYRPDVIHKVCVNLLSHRFQRQGRYPAAGEIVSAESRNTGLGMARIARARGEGFPRAGQAAGVAGVRHGRIAHPPEAEKHQRQTHGQHDPDKERDDRGPESQPQGRRSDRSVHHGGIVTPWKKKT